MTKKNAEAFGQPEPGSLQLLMEQTEAGSQSSSSAGAKETPASDNSLTDSVKNRKRRLRIGLKKTKKKKADAGEKASTKKKSDPENPDLPVRSAGKPKKEKPKKPKKHRHLASWMVTLLLWIAVFVLAGSLWALFISGPSRIYEQQQSQVLQTIRDNVPDVQGLQRTVFDYVTWQGYTPDTLYWFDGNGDIITTRDMETLDYEKARAKALEEYGIEADTIQTAYGYTAPVYEIRGSGRLLLLDYDSLEWIYEREDRS